MPMTVYMDEKPPYMKCEICKKRYNITNRYMEELFMLCEDCRKEVRNGKYGTHIIDWLNKYSLEKQKKELKENLLHLEKTYEFNTFVGNKENQALLICSAISSKYPRGLPFMNTTQLMYNITKYRNLHMKRGSNESSIIHWNNNMARFREYREALEIQNEIFNNLTQKDIEKYLNVMNLAIGYITCGIFPE